MGYCEQSTAKRTRNTPDSRAGTDPETRRLAHAYAMWVILGRPDTGKVFQELNDAAGARFERGLVPPLPPRGSAQQVK